jgi:hypothetical protein
MIEAKTQTLKNTLYFHQVVEIPRRLIMERRGCDATAESDRETNHGGCRQAASPVSSVFDESLRGDSQTMPYGILRWR